MYNYNSNYTFVVPVKSRKMSEYLRAFQECYNKLKQRGFTAHLLSLDNKISEDPTNATHPQFDPTVLHQSCNINL